MINFITVFIDNLAPFWDSILSFLGILVSSFILGATVRAINEQNRPYVSFSIETLDDDISSMLLVIRNTGNGTAENVTITTRPGLISSLSKDKSIPILIDDEGRINISGLAPNQVIKSTFDYSLYRSKDKYDNTTSVDIVYFRKKKKFLESFHLDFSYMDKLSIVKKSNDIPKNIKKIADKLEAIEKKLN